MKTLFDAIKSAGIDFNSHETDLYIPVTEETRAILAQFPLNKGNATIFRNQIDGKMWFDVPFAYVPAWEAKQKRATSIV